MTLLEFVAEQLMGPPAYRSGGGRSTWSCPRHDDNHPSFSTRPHLEGYKDRFQCFSCGFWGDELDLLKEFYPGEGYGERLARLNAMKINHEAEHPPEPQSETAVFSYRGGERDTTERPRYWGDVSDAWADFREQVAAWETSEALAVQILVALRDRCRRERVAMVDVTDLWENFESWKVKSDLRHLWGCDDEDCDARVCRIHRGLDPLRPEEVEAGKRERAEAKRKQKERVRRAIKKHPVSGPSRKKKKKPRRR